MANVVSKRRRRLVPLALRSAFLDDLTKLTAKHGIAIDGGNLRWADPSPVAGELLASSLIYDFARREYDVYGWH